MRRACVPALSLLLCTGAASGNDLATAYERASRLLPWQVDGWLEQPETYAARWSADGRRFAYRSTSRKDARWMLGDARTGVVRAVDQAPEFTVAPATDAAQNPDGRFGIGVEGFNLWLLERGVDGRRALTRDGVEIYAYAPLYSFGAIVEAERAAFRGPMRPAQGAWSPDGRYFATYRYDQRKVGNQYYWKPVGSAGAGKRPQLVVQSSPYPGEPNALAELVLCEIAAGTCRTVAGATFETFLDPFSAGLVQWGADGKALYWLHEGRGLRSVSVNRLDIASGNRRTLYREESATYLMLSGSRYPAIWQVLRDGQELLWFSERDGWGNLYAIDLATGRIRHTITRGRGVVRKLLRVDEAGGWAYFVASGRDPGIDPYFRQLFRARLDGGGTEVLTPEAADHVISMPAVGSVFLDLQSRDLATAPRTLLRALTDGRIRAEVATTDLDPLRARGWLPPSRERVRDADDRYDVFVTVFRPSGYDPANRYPVLDYIYGLSSLARTPPTFPVGANFELGSYFWQAQAMAELGFIVVMLDGPGTPLRGHEFARESYGSGHVDSTLRHHVAAIRQLAARDPSCDLSRVGIFGKSGGGFASTRAMLLYPDFFKVAVSAAGAHDLVRLYAPEWGDRYIGPYEDSRELYAQLSNATFTAQLTGKLLLIHGESDSEVTPAMTQQLVAALIAANRDFDLLYVPDRDHDLDDDPYVVRRRWDYFVTHLLRLAPPPGFRIAGPAEAP